MVQGKLLAVICDHRSPYPSVSIFVQSAHGGVYAKASLMDDVCCDMVLHPGRYLSKRQKQLPEGTTIRLALTCSVHYHQSYEGEWDTDVCIRKTQTAREQLPSRKLLKRWKLFDKQQAKLHSERKQ